MTTWGIPSDSCAVVLLLGGALAILPGCCTHAPSGTGGKPSPTYRHRTFDDTREPEIRTMTTNKKHLEEVRKRTQEFETELESERLREAYMALENVNLAAEQDPLARARTRSSVLVSWLHILRILDNGIDPTFDPHDVPLLLVQPPPLPGGIVLRPGADPAKIPDPATRAQYEKAIADNRAKADRYRLQIELRRLDERVTPRVEAFIHDSYTASRRDQEELKLAIDQSLTLPARKAALSKLLTASPP